MFQLKNIFLSMELLRSLKLNCMVHLLGLLKEIHTMILVAQGATKLLEVWKNSETSFQPLQFTLLVWAGGQCFSNLQLWPPAVLQPLQLQEDIVFQLKAAIKDQLSLAKWLTALRSKFLSAVFHFKHLQCKHASRLRNMKISPYSMLYFNLLPFSPKMNDFKGNLVKAS